MSLASFGSLSKDDVNRSEQQKDSAESSSN